MGERETEREGERTLGHSRVARALAFRHCATPRIAGGVLDAREREGANVTGMPLVCLSAISVAYCNPVPRFRVAAVAPRAFKRN